MKKKRFLFLFLFFMISDSFAQDFLIEFVEEHYKETQAAFSYHPLIYHSIQIKSAAGPKILVLTGEDANYRKWLRYYIARNKDFILKVDPAQTDQFISAKVFETDLNALHPFDRKKWAPDKPVRPDPDILSGDNFFLLIDSDTTRTRLFKTVARKMGYQTLAFKDNRAAFDVFRLQPEKFKMIAAHYAAAGLPAENFVEKVIAVKRNIPVLVDTGYQNKKEKNRLKSKFSDAGSVHIKSVLLNDLQKTIRTLVKKNA